MKYKKKILNIFIINSLYRINKILLNCLSYFFIDFYKIRQLYPVHCVIEHVLRWQICNVQGPCNLE
ncbi:hypothetical protein CHV_c0014 [Cardinium endosymbiont cBtQ1 of Bemisia tabaci]|nr:hypothetical protein CHV_c0014 [Cardinium endosymbiont cBtQ1 of Bemisia tabaci]